MKTFTKLNFIIMTIILASFFIFASAVGHGGSFRFSWNEPIGPIFLISCALDGILGFFLLIGVLVHTESKFKLAVEIVGFIISLVVSLVIIGVTFLIASGPW
ncbi:MAG: hypothetical protein WC587_03385 [Candidatus Paceibacterota bacterium]